VFEVDSRKRAPARTHNRSGSNVDCRATRRCNTPRVGLLPGGAPCLAPGGFERAARAVAVGSLNLCRSGDRVFIISFRIISHGVFRLVAPCALSPSAVHVISSTDGVQEGKLIGRRRSNVGRRREPPLRPGRHARSCADSGTLCPHNERTRKARGPRDGHGTGPPLVLLIRRIPRIRTPLVPVATALRNCAAPLRLGSAPALACSRPGLPGSGLCPRRLQAGSATGSGACIGGSPIFARTFISSSSATSGLSRRNCLAFSRPWPRRTSP
jgi:hypothetical protein